MPSAEDNMDQYYNERAISWNNSVILKIAIGLNINECAIYWKCDSTNRNGLEVQNGLCETAFFFSSILMQKSVKSDNCVMHGDMVITLILSYQIGEKLILRKRSSLHEKGHFYGKFFK